MNPSFAYGLAGLRSAEQLLQTAASGVARMGASATQSALPQAEVDNVGPPVEVALATLGVAKAQTEASCAVIRTAAEMDASVLNVLA